MAAFFVFFTVQYGVTGLLEEEKLGTLPRLLAAPVPPWSVQVGKALGSAVLGVASLTVLAVASNLVLGADWGPPLGVAILILALVVAAVGLMGLVGSFARTAEQAGNAQAIVAIVLGMTGGVFFPIPTDTALLRLLGAPRRTPGSCAVSGTSWGPVGGAPRSRPLPRSPRSGSSRPSQPPGSCGGGGRGEPHPDHRLDGAGAPLPRPLQPVLRAAVPAAAGRAHRRGVRRQLRRP
jgi:hypothetical protein